MSRTTTICARGKLVVVIAWLILLVACDRVPPATPASLLDVPPILTAQVIRPATAERLQQLAAWAVTGAGPVVAVAFASDGQVLKAAYAREGVLRHWRVSDGMILRSFDVSPLELAATAFDAGGNRLATGAGTEWRSHLRDDDYLGIRVWDADAGHLIIRDGEDYHPPSGLLTRNLFPFVRLSPDGTWLLMVRVSAEADLWRFKKIDQLEVETGRIGNGFVDFARRAEQDDFDVIAFDDEGRYFAAADEAGQVAIFPFQPPKNPVDPNWGPGRVVVEPAGELGPTPLALAFDPRRKWLAAVRGNALLVWDLQSLQIRRQLDANVSISAGPTASLSFSPEGDLLAVGTSERWQIWEVANHRLVLDHPAHGVYALAFSPDGRLLAWGDAGGVVHLWGVPDSPR